MSGHHDQDRVVQAPGTGAGTPGGSDPEVWGVLAEFETAEGLLEACRQVRDSGFKRWDAHAPCVVHGLNDAMGIRHTRLPLFVLAGGASGAALALLMQWWMNAHDYKLLISGKPYFSLPANIPVMFELTVLFAAISAFVGMLAFNALPQWFHPLLRNERFRQATQDRFYITIEARDSLFDAAKVREFLLSLGSTHVETVGKGD